MEELNPFMIGAMLIGIGSSLGVVFARHAVASAFYLVVTFLSFAVIYAVQAAHLIAALQILVYTGAITVLFVFVVMLLNADEIRFKLRELAHLRTPWIGFAIVTLFGMIFWILRRFEPKKVDSLEWVDGNTLSLSRLLFSEYILPFELTSFLLLAAIVGVVIIAMRKHHSRE